MSFQHLGLFGSSPLAGQRGGLYQFSIWLFSLRA
jgi:hypothetical protein